MKKLFVTMIVAAFVFAASTERASAQFGVQAGALLPQGNIDTWDVGFGGAAFYKKEQGEGKIGGLVGYYALGDGDATYSIALMPIMALYEYPLGDSFYVGAEAGYTYAVITGGGIGAVGSTAAVAPKVGINLGPLHIEAKYNLLDLSYLSAQVGYSFGGN